MTKEGGNDHYWDTTFSLRPTFRGNICGQYKITVNEALFNNTEPLICKGDYYQFEIITTTNYRFTWTMKVKQDFYCYRQSGAEWTSVVKLLVGELGNKNTDYNFKYTETVRERYAPGATTPEHTYAVTDKSFNMNILLRNDDGTPFNGTNRGVNPIMYYDCCNIVLGDAAYGAVQSISMTYSQGFVYILNNRASRLYPVADDADKPSFWNSGSGDTEKFNYDSYDGHYFFQFCNLRIGGPYLYILDMPTLKADVMTMNELNQSYNITGMVKNTADNHNENIQFISSMEGWVNSLSNFRVRLLNDEFQPVKIRSPLYVQFTISNADD
ncbi:hypothetical protein IKN40_01085 [bacterium]|nr:hypothetical protein [bacterium]